MSDLAQESGVAVPAALSWLRGLLWSPDVDVAIRPGDGGEQVFLCEPDAAAPELLVPAGPPGVTAAVARRSSDARTVAGRLRTTGVELAARTGVVPRLARHRLVSISTGPEGEDPARSFPAHVGRLLGIGTASYAVTMGGPRYNRKPVLTVFDPDGRLVAFAKLGADPVTDAFVANEAHWLGVVGRAGTHRFEAPRVLEAGSWRDRAFVITTPLRPPRLPARHRIDLPPDGLVESVAALGAVAHGPVADSAVIAEARGMGDPRLDAAARAVVDRHGRHAVRTGLWHGDLSPWNLAARRRRPTLLWDWEAAADDRPVGADRLHSLVMVATHLRGTPPEAAVDALTPEDVGSHQVDDDARTATLALYLLDIARRDLVLLAAGVPAGLLPGLGLAALDRLARHG